MMECCDNCKFSQGPFSIGYYDLICRRYPPNPCPDNKEQSYYPAVCSADWCGEWKAKEV